MVLVIMDDGGVEGDCVALIIELDVGDEPFVEQVRTDNSWADLHSILIPLHHLLRPVQHHPHLHLTRDYRSSSSTDPLLPYHPILSEVGNAVWALMGSLVIAAALTDNTHWENGVTDAIEVYCEVVTASCWKGVPS